MRTQLHDGCTVVFPAHAGMIRMAFTFPGMIAGVPRPRGDDPPGTMFWKFRLECSPPTRG